MNRPNKLENEEGGVCRHIYNPGIFLGQNGPFSGQNLKQGNPQYEVRKQSILPCRSVYRGVKILIIDLEFNFVEKIY
jgi:hypothetical protein